MVTPERQREYQRRYRQKHREQVLEKDRQLKAAIPIEVKRAKNAAWRATVSEEWRERKRAYNRERLRRLVAADPDYYSRRRMGDLAKARQKDHENYVKHREAWIKRSSDGARLRRVRIQGGDIARFTDKDWRRLIARYESCCAYCGKRTSELHRDHVIPVARGGRHAVGNIVPACPSCNRSKGKRLIVEWRARQRVGLAA